MTEQQDQFSLLIEDASAVEGGLEGAEQALVTVFGLPVQVASRILGSLPALVLKEQALSVVELLAAQLRDCGFQVRIRGPGRTRVDVSEGASAALAMLAEINEATNRSNRTVEGQVPLLGIRRRSTGSFPAERENEASQEVRAEVSSSNREPSAAGQGDRDSDVQGASVLLGHSRLLEELDALDDGGEFATGRGASFDASGALASSAALDGPGTETPRGRDPELSFSSPSRADGETGFERDGSSYRSVTRSNSGQSERPRIQFEAAVTGNSSASLDDELREVSGMYRADGRTDGTDPRSARMTGNRSAVGMAQRTASGPRGAKRESGSLKWVIGVVAVAILVLVALQTSQRSSLASQFERASRISAVEYTEGDRRIVRGCAAVGDHEFLCRYSQGFFLDVFSRAERPVAALAAERCYSTRVDAGRSGTETMACSVTWDAGATARDYEFEYRSYRDCDTSLSSLVAGASALCTFAVESALTRDGLRTEAPRSERVVRYTMERRREMLNTAAGYVDALELAATSPDGQNTRVVHFAPSLASFVRESAINMAPTLELVYLREPGRESGSLVWSR